jgi:hypothetical protein
MELSTLLIYFRCNDATKIIDQTKLRGRVENNDVYDELAEL